MCATHIILMLAAAVIFALSLMLPAVRALSSVPASRTVRALYAGHKSRWEEYQQALGNAFSQKGIDVQLFNANAPETIEPALIDYIIYAPNGPFSDFSQFRNVKAVLNLWAGVEGVSSNPTLSHSVPLCRMVDPGLRIGMVEYVVGHTFRYHLHTDKMWQRKERGEWWQSESGEAMLPLAQDRTIGILGLGELGGACSDALAHFDFRVLGWSRRERSMHRPGVECLHGKHGLDQVLAESDILVLLLPSTSKPVNIINRETLQKCKPGVAIINCGRGTLIDDDALVDALDSGMVSGATLDVFRVEPLPMAHSFWKHPRVLVTPHIAAKTRAETAGPVIAHNIYRLENKENLLYVVDRDAGY